VPPLATSSQPSPDLYTNANTTDLATNSLPHITNPPTSLSARDLRSQSREATRASVFSPQLALQSLPVRLRTHTEQATASQVYPGQPDINRALHPANNIPVPLSSSADPAIIPPLLPSNAKGKQRAVVSPQLRSPQRTQQNPHIRASVSRTNTRFIVEESTDEKEEVRFQTRFIKQSSRGK